MDHTHPISWFRTFRKIKCFFFLITHCTFNVVLFLSWVKSVLEVIFWRFLVGKRKQIAVKLGPDGGEMLDLCRKFLAGECQPLAKFPPSVTHLRSLIGEPLMESDGMGPSRRIRDMMMESQKFSNKIKQGRVLRFSHPN